MASEGTGQSRAGRPPKRRRQYSDDEGPSGRPAVKAEYSDDSDMDTEATEIVPFDATDGRDCPNPCRHHPISSKYPNGLDFPHAANLNTFIRDVAGAVHGEFPRRVDFGKVHALYLYWEDNAEMNVLAEIELLDEALSKIRFASSGDEFTKEIYPIPANQRAQGKVEAKIINAREDFAQDDKSLLIIYYGGHSRLDQHTGKCVWHANRRKSSAELNWSDLQEGLKKSDGNILFLLDSCAGLGMVKNDDTTWRGTKELIAASGKTGRATAVGDTTFTSALVKVLHSLRSKKGRLLNVVKLHSILLGKQLDYGLQISPHYASLSSRATQSSISIRFPAEEGGDGTATAAPAAVDETDRASMERRLELESRTRVLFSIRLENPSRPIPVVDWIEWLKNQSPAGISSVDVFWDYIRPEGVFYSRSTLLLLTLPVAVWNVLPHNPAYSFIDIVDSENLMAVRATGYVDDASTFVAESHAGLRGDPPPLLSMRSKFGGGEEDVDMAGGEGASDGDGESDSAGAARRPEELSLGASRLLGRHASFPLRPTFDPDFLQAIPEYIYGRLSERPMQIRLFRLFPGQPVDAHVHGELFTTEMSREEESASPPHWLSYRAGSTSPIQERFSAVSWFWGQSRRDAAVLIREDGKLLRLRVSETLLDMLRGLRRVDRDLVVWIDYLCINPTDYSERNSQVSEMARIFAAAQDVIVWLGPSLLDSRLAVDFVHRIMDSVGFLDELLSSPRHAEGWSAVWALLQNPWFSRRWIVQELVLARKASLHMGRYQLDWDDLVVAVEILVALEASLSRSPLITYDRASARVPSWIQNLSKTSAARLVETSRLISRARRAKTAQGNPLSKLLGWLNTERDRLGSLEFLVTSFSNLEVREPRDAVYSMLAIATDQADDEASSFRVDYSVPYVEVCRQFVLFSVKRSRSLDVLCRPWAPPPTQQPYYLAPAAAAATSYGQRRRRNLALPSWIPQLTRATWGLFISPSDDAPHPGRKNADALVGEIPPGTLASSSPLLPYRASLGSRVQETWPKWQWYAAGGGDDDTDDVNREEGEEEEVVAMIVRGAVVDSIRLVANSSQGGAIPEEWLDLAGWERPPDDAAYSSASSPPSPPPDEFWRTLVADRDESGRYPPSYYALACAAVLRTGGLASGAINLNDMIATGARRRRGGGGGGGGDSGLAGPDASISAVAPFCRRVQAVIWNRSLLRTEAGRLGLAPKTAHAGDKVAILEGCSVPVVLREITTATAAAAATQVAQVVEDTREAPEASKLKRTGKTARQRLRELGPLRDNSSAAEEEPTLLEEPRSATADSYFILIGECYIDGIMEGEAMVDVITTSGMRNLELR